MDICFIVDTSVSVDNDEWNDLRQFMEDVISSLAVGTDDARVGYITYSNTAEVSATLDAYATKQEAIDGIWNDITHLNKSTWTNLGLDLARTSCFNAPGDRAGFGNLAIVITDGKSQNSVIQAAQDLRDVPANVLAVGIGPSNDEEELEEIVGNNDSSKWFKLETFAELAGLVTTLLEAACG